MATSVRRDQCPKASVQGARVQKASVKRASTLQQPASLRAVNWRRKARQLPTKSLRGFWDHRSLRWSFSFWGRVARMVLRVDVSRLQCVHGVSLTVVRQEKDEAVTGTGTWRNSIPHHHPGAFSTFATPRALCRSVIAKLSMLFGEFSLPGAERVPSLTSEYSFLTNYFAMRGYLAISIQHDLPTDAPMVTKVGELYVGRQPQYRRSSTAFQ